MDLGHIARKDLSSDLMSLAVKEDNPVRSFEAQNIAAMVRFAASQDQSVRLPFFGRDIEAMHRKSLTADPRFKVTERTLSPARRNFYGAGYFRRRRERKILRASGVVRCLIGSAPRPRYARVDRRARVH